MRANNLIRYMHCYKICTLFFIIKYYYQINIYYFRENFYLIWMMGVSVLDTAKRVKHNQYFSKLNKKKKVINTNCGNIMSI
jgi:hypothetical protein